VREIFVKRFGNLAGHRLAGALLFQPKASQVVW
jgi:hypothetical protein